MSGPAGKGAIVPPPDQLLIFGNQIPEAAA